MEKWDKPDVSGSILRDSFDNEIHVGDVVKITSYNDRVDAMAATLDWVWDEFWGGWQLQWITPHDRDIDCISLTQTTGYILKHNQLEKNQ